MKLHNFPYVLGMSALVLFSFVADGAEVNAWAFKDLRAWAREKDAMKLTGTATCSSSPARRSRSRTCPTRVPSA